jgi:hypothetical protein
MNTKKLAKAIFNELPALNAITNNVTRLGFSNEDNSKLLRGFSLVSTGISMSMVVSAAVNFYSKITYDNNYRIELSKEQQHPLYVTVMNWVKELTSDDARKDINSFEAIRINNYGGDNDGDIEFVPNSKNITVNFTFEGHKYTITNVNPYQSDLDASPLYVDTRRQISEYAYVICKNKEAFDIITKEITRRYEEYLGFENYSEIYTSHGQSFKSTIYPNRPIESVFLQDGVMESIIKHIEDFMSSEKDYRKHGFPFHTGILLYGPPGTGKTSVVSAIGSSMGMDIYKINLSSVSSDSDLEALFSRISPNSIVLLEDIDAVNTITATRDGKTKFDDFDPSASNYDEEYYEEELDLIDEEELDILDDDDLDMTAEELPQAIAELTGAPDVVPVRQRPSSPGVTLSGLLNVLDGITSPEGAVYFMTTNHPENLDPALIRPGRVDLRKKIDYLNTAQLQNIVKSFEELEGYTPPVVTLEDKITPGDIISIFRNNFRSLENVPSEIDAFLTHRRKVQSS